MINVSHDQPQWHTGPLCTVPLLNEGAVKTASVRCTSQSIGITEKFEFEIRFHQLTGTLCHFLFKNGITLLEILERIDLPLLNQVIGNGYATIGDHPCLSLEPENQRQASDFLRKNVIWDREMDMEEGCNGNKVVAQILQADIENIDTKILRHLREILAGDLNPLLPIPDQTRASASKSGEIFAKSRSQPVVPGRIHRDVFIKERADQFMASGWHMTTGRNR